jgi:hypothetical protein
MTPVPTRPSAAAAFCLAAAAVQFWISWALMPGVGVTDAAQIFALVGAQRSAVLWSAALQLLSAVLYVPALLGLSGAGFSSRGIRWGAGILLLGAMGSAADAVFHVLAYAMTAPGLDPAPLLSVMRFMQGPALLMIAPMILAFFVGSIWLSVALARAGVVARWHPWLYALAPVVIAAGGMLASSGVIAPRFVGLSLLAVFSAAQVHAALGVWRVSAASSRAA